MSEYQVLGVRTPRTDALLEASGQVVYGADISYPNMLYAAARYSDYAHARILSVDVSGAERSPGVRAVITAKDVPVNRFGYKFQDQPVLADDKVYCKQDAIAVVAAETEAQAQLAAEKIRVEYEPLTPVLDAVEGMKDQVLVHEGSSNIVARIRIRKGDTQANPSFEVLYTIITALGTSFDAIFNPADEQSEREIQEIAGLYRACPEQVRRLILASIRAMSYELMDTIIKE